MIKTAVIIAGGEGSRLKPLANNKPKAMVEINGHPMLYWIIRWLKFHGIKNLVIGVAYKKEKILEFMRKNANFGLDAHFSAHTLEGGTAQGFKLAISRFVKDEDFLAMNCDEVTNMDIGNLVRVHETRKRLVTMALAPFHCRFSVVENSKDGLVSGFKYGHILEDVLVSIGIYIFNAKVLDYIPTTGSIEDAVFSPLAKKKMMAAYPLGANEEWISVNNVKNVREVEENPQLLKLPRRQSKSKSR